MGLQGSAVTIDLRGWIYVFALAIIIGAGVGLFTANIWMGLGAFVVALVSLPIILIVIGVMGWMASGSH